MSYFSLDCTAGSIVRYSNDYYDFYFDSIEIENITVADLVKKNIQTSKDGGAREYVESGLFAPCTITLTITCNGQKMGEIGRSHLETSYKYDTKGTLEIVEGTGAYWTFENAILNTNPLEKSLDSTATSASYTLIMKAPQPKVTSMS